MKHVTGTEAARILRTYLEREKASKSDTAELIYESLFQKQKDFIDHPAKEKVARCGRRAGKSTGGLGGLAINALRHPGTAYLYAGLTRRSAKRIGWKALKALNQKFNLNLEFNATDLTATFPSGSEIIFIGLDDLDAAESLRGEKFRIILLDESASYGPHLKYIVEEVLTPMLMDEDGALWWMGTPSAACAGPFFDADIKAPKAEVPSFHWTCLDNPFIPHAERWLATYRKKKGWSEDNPIYLREWLGLWRKDESSLVYRYDEDRCRGVLSPQLTWNYILGVDLGYDDATAIVVVAYSESSPNLYVVDEFKKSQMIPSTVADKVREFQVRYSPVATVVDTGGLGKSIAEEMKQRHNVQLKPAEKNKKREYIELMNSDLFEGQVKFTSAVPLLKGEISMLQWDEDRKHEAAGFENHLCDALLYAWRESGHWGYKRPADKIHDGTDAWAAQHERDLAERMQAEEKKNWWEKLFYQLFPGQLFPVLNFDVGKFVVTAAG